MQERVMKASGRFLIFADPKRVGTTFCRPWDWILGLH
jgi:hypothetical protein